MSLRRLIVNADDFGLSHGVNLGVIRAHEEGIVSSASLMVRGEAVHDAAAYAKAWPQLSFGLHFEFGEWVFREGARTTRYQLLSPDDSQSICREAQRQLDGFRKLMGRDPTHIDSHQHFHRREPFLSVPTEIAAGLAVCLRGTSKEIGYFGRFYGQTDEGEPVPDQITTAGLIEIVATIAADVTELSCHPAALPDTGSGYDSERTIELETLCDPCVRAYLSAANVTLCTF